MSTTVSDSVPVGEINNCNGRKFSPYEVDLNSLDDMSRRLRLEALEAIKEEPEMSTLLLSTVLAPGVRTFEDAVACTMTHRLLLRSCHQIPSAKANVDAGLVFCPNSLRGIVAEALQNSSDIREAGHSMSEAVRLDALAICERDPAVDTLLEVVLFLKGFAALVCHRAAYYKWHMTKRKNGKRRSTTSLWLQSQASAVFGVDIHPGATIGAGILLDHGTGIVIGETATVGDGCTLLHGVTLGGTGKESGDRHPKVGRDVLIGANASLLGNIPIGDGAKVGAGSVVLRPIPAHATAVGAPAKIVGRASEPKPGSAMDEALLSVNQLHKEGSTATLATIASSSTEQESDEFSSREGGTEEKDDDQKADLNALAHETKEYTKPRKSKSTKSDDIDAFCPFREYRRIAEIAPAGTITLSTLENILTPTGLRSCQIGGVLFALDNRGLGYIKPDAFFTDRTQAIITETTKLPAEEVASLMSSFRENWRQDRALARAQSTPTSLTHSAPRDISVSG